MTQMNEKVGQNFANDERRKCTIKGFGKPIRNVDLVFKAVSVKNRNIKHFAS